jgi:hypothetical protein
MLCNLLDKGKRLPVDLQRHQNSGYEMFGITKEFADAAEEPQISCNPRCMRQELT